jgi:hypothetical protein
MHLQVLGNDAVAGQGTVATTCNRWRFTLFFLQVGGIELSGIAAGGTNVDFAQAGLELKVIFCCNRMNSVA